MADGGEAICSFEIASLTLFARNDEFLRFFNGLKLIYYEVFNDIVEAITREKQLKKWKRKWKIELIEKLNPAWRDLYYELL